MIEWDTVFYSAPPEVATRVVEARQAVGQGDLEIRFAGRLVATHRLVPAGSDPQWLPEHRAAAEAIALGRKHLRAVTDHPEVIVPTPATDLDLGHGDYDVEPPDLAELGVIGPLTGSRSLVGKHFCATDHVTWLRLLRRAPVTAAALVEGIKDDLGYLKLHRSAEVFAALADVAQRDDQTHLEFLAAVLAEEVTATRQRRLNARLRFAHFPFRKTIEDFDFSFQPSIDPKIIWDLADIGFVEAGHPALLLGRPAAARATSGSASASAPSRPATGATSPAPPT